MAIRKKIINDPVFGFITVSGHLLELVAHRYVERLSRIRQLGLSSFVYPGANHTRFLHSVGAMHLMAQAIDQLRREGHEISAEEGEAARMAILLHDLGHGPFSHVMEHSLVSGISHEDISERMMRQMLVEYRAQMGEESKFCTTLELAIAIFNNTYPKRFLHQLVSSQLDMDRMDYLCRDSFFCGVSEGAVASDRIISMLNVVDDQLVVDSKGLYSVEKFLVARRFMYWQVYLHKTSVAAEQLLLRIMRRAREVQALEGISPALRYFLSHTVTGADFDDPQVLERYAMLDDSDIWAGIKSWSQSGDRILELLCKALMHRRLFKAEVLNVSKRDVEDGQLEIPGLEMPPSASVYIKQFVDEQVQRCAQMGFTEAEAHYFYDVHRATSNMYKPEDDQINILYPDGRLQDISEASNLFDVNAMQKKLEKYYLYKLREAPHVKLLT